MRITKKVLRESKAAMRHRIIELCAILATGGIKQELERCMPGVTIVEGNDPEMLRMLLCDLLELSLPRHWID